MVIYNQIIGGLKVVAFYEQKRIPSVKQGNLLLCIFPMRSWISKSLIGLEYRSNHGNGYLYHSLGQSNRSDSERKGGEIGL